MANIFQAIINFFIEQFSQKSPSTSALRPQAVESVKTTPINTSFSLSWEKGNPTRFSWSAYLKNLIYTNYDAIMSASDIERVFPGIKLLDKNNQIDVLAEFICWICYYECGWDASDYSVDVGSQGDKNTWSVGLMQLSVVDQANLGIPMGFNFQDLQDPLKNLSLGIAILVNQIKKRGKIFIAKGEKGNPSLYWATICPGGTYDKTDAILAKVKKSYEDSIKQTGDTPVVFMQSWIEQAMTMLGWTEFDHDKELSVYWKWTNVPYYKTVIGTNYAWCALFVGACLELAGIKGSRDAGADSYIDWGKPCDFWFGAICPIRHASGGHHVTFFLYWIDESKRIGAFLGGNQGNAVNVSIYNVSGNASGNDEIVNGKPRWPIGKSDGVIMSKVSVLSAYPKLASKESVGTR